MKCPTCTNQALEHVERQGFLIDFCPNCRGMWFERGELDKILAKLNQIDLPEETSQKVGDMEADKSKEGHSPIMDSIYASKELHHLHNTKGRPHWIHRLFD